MEPPRRLPLCYLEGTMETTAASPIEIARRGLLRGLRLFLALLKVMVPAYVAVSLLKQTPFLDAAVRAVAPLMRWVGLPPSAAVPAVVICRSDIPQ